MKTKFSIKDSLKFFSVDIDYAKEFQYNLETQIAMVIFSKEQVDYVKCVDRRKKQKFT